jgi:6,7-dimethyl-8-ribityllumazine synthase
VLRIEGSLLGEGLRVGLVISRFNDLVTRSLREGALDGLFRHGVTAEDVVEVWVPGSFELPQAASRLVASGRFDAVICLGCVIRGETPHWEYVSAQAARGIAEAGVRSGVPVVFGVVVAESMDQALERAGGKQGNRGLEAALSALEMATLFRRLREQGL